MTFGEFIKPMNLTPLDWWAIWVFLYLDQLYIIIDGKEQCEIRWPL
jgi:hypothetical protein